MIVSISEAAKLTKKNRRTLQRHIAAGKLSKSTTATGDVGVDISELMRVYGQISLPQAAAVDAARQSHSLSPHNAAPKEAQTERIAALENEVDALKSLLEAKQEHIDSLNRAMLLLENKEPKSRSSIWNLFRKK